MHAETYRRLGRLTPTATPLNLPPPGSPPPRRHARHIRRESLLLTSPFTLYSLRITGRPKTTKCFWPTIFHMNRGSFPHYMRMLPRPILFDARASAAATVIDEKEEGRMIFAPSIYESLLSLLPLQQRRHFAMH